MAFRAFQILPRAYSLYLVSTEYHFTSPSLLPVNQDDDDDDDDDDACRVAANWIGVSYLNVLPSSPHVAAVKALTKKKIEKKKKTPFDHQKSHFISRLTLVFDSLFSVPFLPNYYYYFYSFFHTQKHQEIHWIFFFTIFSFHWLFFSLLYIHFCF